MRLSGWSLPLEHLSASSIASFVACPEAFRLRRLKNIPETVGVDRFVGTCFHDSVAENFSQKIRTGRDLPLEKTLDNYTQTWEREIVANGEPEWYDSDPVETHQHGQLMLQTYHEVVAPTVYPTAVESRFEEQLPDVPVKVVGYIDVEETNRIIELKTSKTRHSKPKPGWLLQGRLYSLIYSKPIEWQVTTKAKTPTLCFPLTDPGLRLEVGNYDSTILLIQQAAYMMNDLYQRYGSDTTWPLHGLIHPFQCATCFAGPKYRSSCVAWGGDGYPEGEENHHQVADRIS